MFLSSEKGKRVLNFLYSWGASVVILGTLFKILHLPYGNMMISIGMITEFFVFFVFGFEQPSSDYRWEDVFPVLKSKNPLDRPEFTHASNAGRNTGGGSVGGGNFGGGGGNFTGEGNAAGGENVAAGGGFAGGGNFGGGGFAGGGNFGGGGFAGGGAGFAGVANLSEDDSKNLSAGIQKLLDAADQIAKMPQLTDATQKYLEQLSAIAGDMERFSSITHTLSNVSDGINRSSQGYVQQMEMLSRNVSGLNTIYEVQLRSISSQISSIEHINAGLNRIKDLYDGSIVDSSVFRSETEKMAQQLTQLNQVYSRLLQAMTVNMGVPVMPNPYQTK
ncbi:MAG: gliding motility protein GldL [Tannerellaceae bacterium]|nr:gliding motility protein GldL [Tannerellaceae bacterium]